MTEGEIKTERRENRETDLRWRRGCPLFSGKQEEYENWRGRVEDWLALCKDEAKYPGLEIRVNLNGKAWDVTKNLDRKLLMNEGGEEILLEALDKVYKKDTVMENYEKMLSYIEIKREKGESMRDYLIRYEKLSEEGRKPLGREMLEGEVKGVHVMAKAGLSEQQRRLVLTACGKEKLEYEIVKGIMKRIFEGLDEEERSESWLEKDFSRDQGGGVRSRRSTGRGRFYRGGGRRKNPLNNEGKVSKCIICQSEWHWAYDCPQNYKNKEATKSEQEKEKPTEKDSKNDKEKEIYMSGISVDDEEMWGHIEAILDTGCGPTVCGEL